VGPDAFVLEASGSASTALAALVFGNEKHGLTNDDLAHCNRFVRIATADAQPSLNLAQAAAICCYEVARHGNPAGFADGRTGRPRAPARASRASIDALASVVGETVAAKRGEAAAVRAAATLRDLLGRADARERDVSFLRGLLALLPHVDR
jgi:tRNA/rRNA methyltransferase